MKTGPYILQKGEYVIPSGEARNISMGGYSPTINIYPTISSDMDIDKLVEKINERLHLDWKSTVM